MPRDKVICLHELLFKLHIIHVRVLLLWILWQEEQRSFHVVGKLSYLLVTFYYSNVKLKYVWFKHAFLSIDCLYNHVLAYRNYLWIISSILKYRWCLLISGKNDYCFFLVLFVKEFMVIIYRRKLYDKQVLGLYLKFSITYLLNV